VSGLAAEAVSLRDAGEAAKGMEKIASLFKPEGFFDPKVPAGTATPPERDPSLPPPDPDAPPDPRFARSTARCHATSGHTTTATRT